MILANEVIVSAGVWRIAGKAGLLDAGLLYVTLMVLTILDFGKVILTLLYIRILVVYIH